MADLTADDIAVTNATVENLVPNESGYEVTVILRNTVR